MRFDSNKAWQEATLIVAANKDVLWALAGVFFVLPSFAVAVAFPQPDLPAGMPLEQMLKRVDAYYQAAAPALWAVIALGIFGSLAILAVIGDGRRPTVGQALQIAGTCMASVLAAVLLSGLGLLIVGVLVVALAAISGSNLVTSVAMFGWLGFALYAGIRTALVLPIIVVEGSRNPVIALRRSWALTQPHQAALGLFIMLLLITAWVLMVVVMLVVGTILALLFGLDTARIIAALLSSVLSASISLVLVGAIAAVHRQLAGPPD